MAKSNLKSLHRLIAAAKNEIPINEVFLNDLKACIEKIDAQEARKPSKSYKPSSLKCIRNMYFQKIGAELDEVRGSYCLVGICESGTDRHIRIQDAISKMAEFGMDWEYIDVADYVTQKGLTHLEIVGKSGMETKLYHKDLGISFLCDGIIRHKDEYMIFEFKTETIYKWQMRDGVAAEHIPQATCYTICFGINKVLFVYENRDNCDKKSYIYEASKEAQNEVVTKIKDCDGYVERLIAPPIPSDIDKKTCAYCNYKVECRKAGK